MFPEQIRTNRLLLEKPGLRDMDALEYFNICSGTDAEKVAESVGWDVHETPFESYKLLERYDERWNKGEEITYFLRLNDSEEFIGQGSIEFEWDLKRAEMGCWLLPDYWGNEYATERAVALTKLAFNFYNMEVVRARCFLDSNKSKKSIKKYMKRMGGTGEPRLVRNDYRDSSGIRDVYYFSITSEEFDYNGQYDELELEPTI